LFQSHNGAIAAAYTYGLQKGYEHGWKDAVDALTEDELDDAEVS